MMPLLTDAARYRVIAQKDAAYDGLFFVGVKSTGIFCRPGCPARVPKAENCSFHDTAKDALLAGFRACKRCHPLRAPREAGPLITRLIALVEAEPERRWTQHDLTQMGIDPSTARRQFLSRFGVSFAAYARARRLGRAARAITKGNAVIEGQLTAGYESASGFRRAFGQSFGQPPKLGAAPLFIEWLDSPLGPIIVITDEDRLYLLEFTARKNLAQQLSHLSKALGRAIVPGRSGVTDHIEAELAAYFSGRLKSFTTPLALTGTEFQKSVWAALCTIPYGETRSYAQLAVMIGHDKAVRAVASSNARNGLALIVPCHRVIASGGALGGYAGGLARKQWLLDLEAGRAVI